MGGGREREREVMKVGHLNGGTAVFSGSRLGGRGMLMCKRAIAKGGCDLSGRGGKESLMWVNVLYTALNQHLRQKIEQLPADGREKTLPPSPSLIVCFFICYEVVSVVLVNINKPP